MAGSLIELLDERKAVRSRQELNQLASRYNMELSVLESLARFVNSPTPDASKSRKIIDQDNTERFITPVCNSDLFGIQYSCLSGYLGFSSYIMN